MNNKKTQILGLSLIEVLVTIVISSIGLMGLLSLQMQSLRATSDTGNRSHAIWVRGDMINRIKANKDARKYYVTTDSNVCIPAEGTTPAKTPSLPTKKCSNYHTGADGGTAFTIAKTESCTGEELATWDLYEVTCGSPMEDGVHGNAISYLPEAKLTIACVASSIDCKALTISLEWKARADREETTGAARTANSGILTLPPLEFTP